MAKRERSKDIKKMIKEGRGTGIGKDYIPCTTLLRIDTPTNKYKGFMYYI